MIYKCKRTATIVSRNYNTMARISFFKYREVSIEYPMFEKTLKQYLYNYNDKKIQFLRQIVTRVDYLKHSMTKEIFYDLIFKLVPVNYERGQMILKQFSYANSLMFVEYGVVEVYTQFEGNEFIIEKLYSGSVINYRSFFMQDLMHVNIRCTENCQLLELRQDELKNIMELHEELGR